MNMKFLGGVLGILLIMALLFFIFGPNETTEDLQQNEVSNEEGVVAVPLSSTDEAMEQNASNEQRFGTETSYQVSDGKGGMRDATVQEIAQFENAGVELAFEHVSPGEYSEVYGAVRGIPGETVVVELSGPGVMNTNQKEVLIGAEGYTNVTWRINQYGTYTATYTPFELDFKKGSTTITVN